ncbi:MAG TPA: hypothetical protein VK875_05480 [Euzebyales bacterium]|nr:hypothetical protein [Euzebyales bacterium]
MTREPVDRPVQDRRTDEVPSDGSARQAAAGSEAVAPGRTEPGVADSSQPSPDATAAPDPDRQIPRDPSSERVEPSSSGPGAATDWASHSGMLPDDEIGGFQGRWDEIQVRFIDEPRQSVREADDLVGEVTRQIAQRFTDARQGLEQRWEGGNEPTTEELRQALQRYRDFFQRLVAR